MDNLNYYTFGELDKVTIRRGTNPDYHLILEIFNSAGKKIANIPIHVDEIELFLDVCGGPK